MSRKLRVLLVEDNPGDVFLVKDVLSQRQLPHEMDIATDGAEALDRLFERDGSARLPIPDLIILDLNLPRVSGHQVLRQVKASAALRAIPVVILSSSSAEEEIKAAYENYANCYVCKPSRLEEFSRVLQSIEGFWFSTAKLPPIG